MIPRFFTRVHGKTKLPLTKEGKAIAGTNLGRVRSLVWDVKFKMSDRHSNGNVR